MYWNIVIYKYQNSYGGLYALCHQCEWGIWWFDCVAEPMEWALISPLKVPL